MSGPQDQHDSPNSATVATDAEQDNITTVEAKSGSMTAEELVEVEVPSGAFALDRTTGDSRRDSHPAGQSQSARRTSGIIADEAEASSDISGSTHSSTDPFLLSKSAEPRDTTDVDSSAGDNLGGHGVGSGASIALSADMSQSWAARLPQSGSLGMGNHSLMQLISALGTEQEGEEEDAPRQPELSPIASPEASQVHTGEPHTQSVEETEESQSSDVQSDDEPGEDSDSSDRPPSDMASSLHAIHSPISRYLERSRHVPMHANASIAQLTADYQRQLIQADEEAGYDSEEDYRAYGDPATVGFRRNSVSVSPESTFDPIQSQRNDEEPDISYSKGKQRQEDEITLSPNRSPDLEPRLFSRRRSSSSAGFGGEDRSDDEQVSSEMRKSSRRATLATKLREVFSLQQTEKIVAEYPCWLYRSVLLQGFMYLTEGHLCFYAYLKSKEGQSIRSGALQKRGRKSFMYTKWWCVLKDDVFSWYPSSAEPYFPIDQIDLHYVLSIGPSSKSDKHFKIQTSKRFYRFAADTAASCQEWIKTLKRVTFRAQNEGESVKIAIPLESIAAVNLTENLEFAKTTMRLTVRPDAVHSEIEEDYYWSFFTEPDKAVENIRETIARRLAKGAEAAGEEHVLDSTANSLDHTVLLPSSTPGQATPLALHTSQVNTLTNVSPKSHTATPAAHGARHPQHRSSLSTLAAKLHQSANTVISVMPFEANTSAKEPRQSLLSKQVAYAYPMDASVAGLDLAASQTQSTLMPGLTYPPGGNAAVDSDLSTTPTGRTSAIASAAWAIPGLLKQAPKKILAVPSAIPFSNLLPAGTPLMGGKRKEQDGNTDRATDQPLYEAPELDVHEEYRSWFHLGAREHVLARHHAYLFRGIPIYGQLYVSNNYLCFSSWNVVGKTKMILPLCDIIAVQKARSYRFGYHGLIVVVRGHEEIFFEISTASKRDDLLSAVEDMLEETHIRLTQGQARTEEERQALDLKDLEGGMGDKSHFQLPEKIEETTPIMFSSTTSSFITFKPPKSLHITCLAIGSRGDVQPYIALCKGLMHDGHTCRIASHPEYGDWVKSHGIDFRAVGGDPAELMRICVEHGMFTVSFLKEGVAKFRGWLDQLLASSWTACEGTDVLIESPSTMAGCHVAEALQIPYYRAFTMPWTRTRAYPHAFAVPDVKMGGGYNYMTYTIFDQVFWHAIAGQINHWRKKQLGLQPTSLEKLEPHRTPFLYNFSPSVVPPPLDWMEFIHVTGYWFLENADTCKEAWSPPAALLAFMGRARASGKKLVYIGFGSIVVSDPEGLTKTIIAAVKEADVFAIISKGWSDRTPSTSDSAEMKAAKAKQDAAELALLPPIIHNISSIPHDWLFPQVDAVCHHGGAGTTGASLRAGKPTIIRPFFGDQAFWAERVEALRVGVSIKRMTVSHLAHALQVVTHDELIAKRAQALSLQIKNEDGVRNAVEAIYRDLEYAKSLIKRNTRLDARQSHPAETRASAPLARKSDKPRMPSGTVSDESSSWDMMSERTSSGADGGPTSGTMSEPEFMDDEYSGSRSEGDDFGTPHSPVANRRSRSMSRSVRCVSRARNIIRDRSVRSDDD